MNRRHWTDIGNGYLVSCCGDDQSVMWLRDFGLVMASVDAHSSRPVKDHSLFCVDERWVKLSEKGRRTVNGRGCS